MVLGNHGGSHGIRNGLLGRKRYRHVVATEKDAFRRIDFIGV